MALATTNRPRLSDVQHLPVAELMALPAQHLALLQEDAAAGLDEAKRTKDWIEGIIAVRYQQRAVAARAQQRKDTGSVRFEDDGVTVVADLPKKVEWDQVRLAALVERIRAGGDDANEYVEVSFKVRERNYGAWPASIRAAFEPARTVRTGKPTFKLSLSTDQGGI